MRAKDSAISHYLNAAIISEVGTRRDGSVEMNTRWYIEEKITATTRIAVSGRRSQLTRDIVAYKLSDALEL